MPNYQNGKVYMIESLSANKRYYGSTTQTLAQRLAQHRSRKKINVVDTNSTHILQYPDAKIVLVANVSCNSKEELEAVEAKYIRENECVNKKIPQRTSQQYRQDTRDIKRQNDKQYYQDNANNIKQYQKQYYKDNKEYVNRRNREYSRRNKEKIRQHNGKKISCDYCNITFSLSRKARHIRTANHKRNFKAAYLECFGESFTGELTNNDY